MGWSLSFTVGASFLSKPPCELYYIAISPAPGPGVTDTLSLFNQFTENQKAIEKLSWEGLKAAA